MVEENSEDRDDNRMEVDGEAEQQDRGSDDEGGWRIADDIRIPPPPKAFGEIDTKGPRLMIVKIVAKNFKSYAGTVVIGPFHECFSSIIGPNGNGKSNAIDSMLFVFGYRANKIRTKKITELIHNSKESPNCNSCSVSVHFQQIIDKTDTDYEIVPNSEFVISRTAFRDSSAFYELNGRKVQFKAIAKVLRSHHVDLDHNRFLILQGEVEQIALMKPKGQGEGDAGMLEFLEDIIGTTRYKEPLTKLFERVETITEQREEKLRRLKVVEKAKLELEAPMQEAVQFLKVENSIIKHKFRLYQCKKYETVQKLTEEEEKKKELDTDLSELVSEMKKVQEAKEEKNTEYKEKTKKWDKLQQEKDSLTSKFDECRKQDEALHAESVATNKRRKENINTIKTEKNKLDELNKVPEKNIQDIEECEKLAEKLAVDLKKEEAALTTLMSGLNKKIEPLSNTRSVLEKKLVTLKDHICEAKAAHKLAKSKLDLYTSEEQAEKQKLVEIQESLKENLEKLQNRQEQLNSFVPKIPLTEQNLAKAQSELQVIVSKEQEASAKLRSMRVKFDEQRSQMQSNRSRNRILDSLMQEKRSGRIPGIIGRLGDLGAIDVKYDVAISTACGPLDNIVVDTVNTAQECINFLRAGNIGRATFIALEKQQRFAQQCTQKIKTPENVHRLFDLIRVEDPKVLPAFYYGLQNTLVANDLDQATRIAYGAQRYRVVTLKGELIEISGTMSGGGRSCLRGRMGQKVVRSEPSAEDIEKLQQSLDEIYNQCNQLQAQQTPLRDQIQTLSTALNQMKLDQQKFTMEIANLKQQEPILKKRVKEQEQKAKNAICDPRKVQQLQRDTEEAENNLKKVEDNAKETENQVAAVNKEIEEISGGKVKESQRKITNIKKSLDKTKAEICRLEVAIKTAERNAKKTEQRIANLETEITECENRIREIQKIKGGLEDEAKKIIDELKVLNNQLEERDEASKCLRSELEKLQVREGKMKALKIDLDQKMNEIKKTMNELQHKIPEYTKSIQNLKLQDIPNEDIEPLAEMTEEELKETDIKNVALQLQKAQERLPKDIPNMQIIDQYREQNEMYLKRSEKLQKITEERNRLRESYSLGVRKRMQEFNAGFQLITSKLKEMYRMITLGGDAELEYVDSLDPFSEGIVFSVRPPKKSWKYIQNLSGGEKTLSSLALVFALHHYKPTPVYFMDEIDAALDFKNVSIVASYIKERTKNAQFIVISHRSDMFELADYLVGIYKTFNCSHCAALDVKKFHKKVGIEPLNNLHHNKQSNFYTQPVQQNGRIINAGNKVDTLQPQKLVFPSTCPENVIRPNSNTNDKINQKLVGTNNENRKNKEKEQENEDPDLFLNLGDVSIPSTPQKTHHPSKKRRIDTLSPTMSTQGSQKNIQEKSKEVTAKNRESSNCRSENSSTNVTPEKNAEQSIQRSSEDSPHSSENNATRRQNSSNPDIPNSSFQKNVQKTLQQASESLRSIADQQSSSDEDGTKDTNKVTKSKKSFQNSTLRGSTPKRGDSVARQSIGNTTPRRILPKRSANANAFSKNSITDTPRRALELSRNLRSSASQEEKSQSPSSRRTRSNNVSTPMPIQKTSSQNRRKSNNTSDEDVTSGASSRKRRR